MDARVREAECARVDVCPPFPPPPKRPPSPYAPRIDELALAHDADGFPLRVPVRALRGVVVAVEVEPAVSARGEPDVAVLRQVAGEPDGGLVGLLSEAREAAGRVLRPHVEDPELALERRRDELVHLNVAAVKVDADDAVADVGLPPHGVHAQVEELDVAVVVPGGEAPLLVAVAVPEAHRPALPAPRAPPGRPPRLRRLEGDDGVADARVPDLDRAVPPARRELGGAVPDGQAPDPVDAVHHARVRAHGPDGLGRRACVEVEDGHVPAHIPDGQVPVLEEGGAEGRALDADGVLHLPHDLDLLRAHLVDDDGARAARVRAQDHEAGRDRDPPDVGGRKVQRLGQVLDDLGGVRRVHHAGARGAGGGGGGGGRRRGREGRSSEGRVGGGGTPIRGGGGGRGHGASSLR
jgi:hypothetical protein